MDTVTRNGHTPDTAGRAKHAVIYDRASTVMQRDNWSRDDAARIGRELAEHSGYTWELRQEIKSGETLHDRPVMMGILKDIEAGKVQAIICQNFARLSRDEDGIDGRMIRRICQDNACLIITPQKVYDFSQDADHDMSDFEFLVGKIQKRANIRNLTTGLKERARQGYLVGWKAKLGYQRVASERIYKDKVIYWPEIVPEEADLIQLVFDALLREGNPGAAARWLNLNGYQKPFKYARLRKKSAGLSRAWRRDDILHIVTDELYTGWLVYGENCQSRYMAGFETQRNYHSELAIVDRQTFDRCRDLLASTRGRVPPKAKPYPFSSVLKCRGCGGALGGCTNSGERRSYQCNNRPGQNGYRVCEHPQFLSERVVARVLIPYVANLLSSIGEHWRPALDEAAREMSAGGGLRDRIIAEAQAESTDVEKQIDNLARGVAAGVLQPDQARRTSQELAEKKQRLHDKIGELQQKVEIEAEFRRAIERLSTDIEADLWAMFEHAPVQLGQLLRFLFGRASVLIASHGSTRHRQAEIAEYHFSDDFAGLIASVSAQTLDCRAIGLSV